eukprot:8549099-Lingulodinium_polyedra.AAC.1
MGSGSTTGATSPTTWSWWASTSWGRSACCGPCRGASGGCTWAFSASSGGDGPGAAWSASWWATRS